ncbi:MAG: hypothetical protein IJ269_08005 [Bacteroidales bacterium]|nr:hypothetical protein [Bacteroidales bacterium]
MLDSIVPQRRWEYTPTALGILPKGVGNTPQGRWGTFPRALGNQQFKDLVPSTQREEITAASIITIKDNKI